MPGLVSGLTCGGRRRRRRIWISIFEGVRKPLLPKREPVGKQGASGTTTSQTLGAISTVTVAEFNQNSVIASQLIRPEVRGFKEPNETPAPGKRTLVALGVGSGRIHQTTLKVPVSRVIRAPLKVIQRDHLIYPPGPQYTIRNDPL